MAEPMESSDTLRSVSSVRAERERALVERFGGFDWWADFLGFTVAVFFTVLLFGIVGAVVGTVGYQMNATVPKVGGPISGATQQLGLAGLIGGLIALFVAYLVGGYAAGRMARFSGALNGLGVVLWTIIVTVILGIVGGALGTSFNVAKQLNLHIDTTTAGVAGAISLIVSLIVMALAAMLGGRLGEGYHRPIDREAGIR